MAEIWRVICQFPHRNEVNKLIQIMNSEAFHCHFDFVLTVLLPLSALNFCQLVELFQDTGQKWRENARGNPVSANF
jgi:hypothetical protein